MLAIVFRFVAEIGAPDTGYSKGLGITDSIKNHVQRVAADIANSANTGSFIFNKAGAERNWNPAAATTAGLNIVNFAQLAGLHNFLNLSHIRVKTGLEANGKHLAILLFGTADSDRFFQRDAHGLFQQHMYAGI